MASECEEYGEMESQALLCTFMLIGCFQPLLAAAGAKATTPQGWAYIREGPTDVRQGPAESRRAIAELGRGALAAVYESVSKGAVAWNRLRTADMKTLSSKTGWVRSDQIDVLPFEQFPSDATLLKQLGGVYLEDYTASHTELARFIVRRGVQEPALVCFLWTPVLPHARLQIFLSSHGQFSPGPFLEFPRSEMDAGITELEVRDLLGNSNESLVSREPFRLGPENRGLNLVIRRIEDSSLKILWKAPLEFRNLTAFAPSVQKLDPPIRNMGMPGTVTKAEIEFRLRGSVREPVWKGTIELHVFGREEPIETLKIEKVCAWDGSRFMPLL